MSRKPAARLVFRLSTDEHFEDTPYLCYSMVTRKSPRITKQFYILNKSDKPIADLPCITLGRQKRSRGNTWGLGSIVIRGKSVFIY